MPTALVTGASGFIGGELVKQLLERGYQVKATARCSPNSSRLAHLNRVADASPGTLQLVQVPDIEAPSAALDSAVEGARYVFHVASPFRFDGDPVKDVVNPAINGTRVLIEAAAKHKATVRRVVVTSSVCAIHDMNAKQQPKAADGKYTEDDWNDVSQVDTEPYWVSKVEAERLALKLGKELGLDVVTILPNFVLGPIFSETTNGVSVGFLKSFLEAPDGKVPSGNWTCSDVRDVAKAHVLAAETPSAHGRYIISQPMSISARYVTDVLKARYPSTRQALPDGEEAEVKHMIGTTKVQDELGLSLTPMDDTIRDMAEALLTLGVSRPAWYPNLRSM